MLFPETCYLSILPPLARYRTGNGHCSTCWTLSADFFIFSCFFFAGTQPCYEIVGERGGRSVAAKLITIFRDRQSSHIGRRNTALWPVLLYSHVSGPSLLTDPLSSLFMKNLKQFFMSSSCRMAKCHELHSMRKPRQVSLPPYFSQKLCCLQNWGKVGKMPSLLAVVFP